MAMTPLLAEPSKYSPTSFTSQNIEMFSSNFFANSTKPSIQGKAELSTLLRSKSFPRIEVVSIFIIGAGTLPAVAERARVDLCLSAVTFE